MTKNQIREWLFANWIARNERTEREMACIFSQDDWKHLAARGESYRSQRWGEDSEVAQDDDGVDEALGFALTGLVEGHDKPHLTTCPAYKNGETR